MIDINKMTLGELKEIQNIFNNSQSNVSPWEVGKAYFIRTVTMHLIGRLIFISDKELKLEEASWIADSDRFYDALKSGELNEVEPFIKDVIINRSAIVDATEWLHEFPRVQK